MIENRDWQNALKRGYKLLKPYLHLEGQIAQDHDTPSFKDGIELIESVATQQVWEANWLLGKAYEANGEFKKSALQFAIAFESSSNNREVVHEYILSLLRIGESDYAEQVLKTAGQKNDPLIRFDCCLVKFAQQQYESAAQCLGAYDWPQHYVDRVKELSKRIELVLCDS